MKILFVANEYTRRGVPTTGFPNYLFRVSKALIDMGHTPFVVTAGKSSGVRIEEGIKVYTVDYRPVNYRNESFSFIFNSLKSGWFINKKINEICSKTTIDMIQFTSLNGLALFYRGKVPAILRLSSYAKIYYGTFQTVSKSTVKWMSWLELLSATKCKAIFAPCKNTAVIFGKDAKRKVSVIETPFVNDVKQNDYDIYEKHLSEKKYILFFGILSVEKGILVIQKLIRDFLKDNQGYHFVFVGKSANINGKDARKLLLEAAGAFKKRVIMLEPLTHEKLYPIIKKADFIVLPYLSDNLPNACIEAMYFGKLVVGFDGSSVEQLISHNENGLLCKMGDVRDLLQKMQIAVNMDAVEKNKLEESAKRRIDKLRPEVAVKQLLKFYEKYKGE